MHQVEWGQAADPEEIRRLLQRDPGFTAVLVTHNETSTGVMNPLPEIAAAIRSQIPDALILVDGVSGLGAVPFEMDAWGLDVVVTGSQKTWMSAPGVAMIALSERAWQAASRATMPRAYFDLAAAREFAAKGQTPWTPAVAVMYQLDDALGMMEAETLAGVFRRHQAVAAATRAGLEALGFRLYADPRHRPPRSRARGCRTASTGRSSTRRSWSAASSWPAVRARHPARPFASATWATSRSSASSTRCGSSRRSCAAVRPAGDRRSRHRGRRTSGSRRRIRIRGADGVARGRGRRPLMRILVAEPLAAEGLERLRARHEVEEHLGLDAAHLREIVGTYEGLVVRSQVKVDAALIDAGERLVVIGRAGVGVDNVDVEAATRRGITVVNAPTGNTIAAAELTIALLFGLARHVAAADASMRRGEWTRSKFMGVEAQRPDPRHRGLRQDRPGRGGPGPRPGDARPGQRSVPHRRGSGHPSASSSSTCPGCSPIPMSSACTCR